MACCSVPQQLQHTGAEVCPSHSQASALANPTSSITSCAPVPTVSVCLPLLSAHMRARPKSLIAAVKRRRLAAALSSTLLSAGVGAGREGHGLHAVQLISSCSVSSVGMSDCVCGSACAAGCCPPDRSP